MYRLVKVRAKIVLSKLSGTFAYMSEKKCKLKKTGKRPPIYRG